MSDRIAVITGASRGIGLAAANALIQENYKVYGLCRSAAKCREKVKTSIQWLGCDVTQKTSVEAAFKTIVEAEGRIDVLINNAGMGISGAIEFAQEEDIEKQLSVNLNGAIRCTQQVIPVMRKNGGGKIIFISSLGAIFPLPYQSFYSVSKAGLNAFCDALHLEAAPFHIQTCTVLLNDVKTEFTDYRQKNIAGNDLYGGRICRSVEKMEKSEQNGMSAEQVGKYVQRLLRRKTLPPHAIVGADNKLLGLLYRLLPTGAMLKILGWIYG